MIQWGISALSHDAAITVIKDKTEILFASHSERYSHVKNDKYLHISQIIEALQYGEPDEIVWYEKPYKKKLRQLYAGQYSKVFDFENTPKAYLTRMLKPFVQNLNIKYVDHHESHAAGGYFTSPFDSAAIVVVDSIGEFDTVSIWRGEGNRIEKIWSETYPNSVGLFYSAITKAVGLKPNEDEYILMGMAAFGKPQPFAMSNFVEYDRPPSFKTPHNFHRGLNQELMDQLKGMNEFDIAASAQQVVEEYMQDLVNYAMTSTGCWNVVLSGGVALNCVANEKVARDFMVDNIWILPNPGDAGSSLGAVAAYNKVKLNWHTPYLGTNIDRPYPHKEILEGLLAGKVFGVANGRAEFGPRALGNRSLITDPRGPDAQRRVNDIKKRQQFRPFAPIILEEYAHKYFYLPVQSAPYMQFTAKCKFPDQFPAICHVDGSSRVQTVNQQQHPELYAVMKEFYELTGCPMILNTSLNVKGYPLVNDWNDAIMFSQKYNIEVY